MKRFLLFILITSIFYMYSCSSDPAYFGNYLTMNNSEQKVEIFLFQFGQIKSSTVLFKGESDVINYSNRGGFPSPPPFIGDSVIITYNDTVSITHYRVEEQSVMHNIWDDKSWKGGQVDDYEYRYEYIITDADYEEALNRQMK